MWILLVEMLVALSLFILIVWWTMRSRKQNQPIQAPPDSEKTEIEKEQQHPQ